MPLVTNFDTQGDAWLVTEGEDTFLMVLIDGQGCFRFKIGIRSIARLNVESAARILTRVQNGFAYMKDGEENSLILKGP
jgi:hypothetical protein